MTTIFEIERTLEGEENECREWLVISRNEGWTSLYRDYQGQGQERQTDPESGIAIEDDILDRVIGALHGVSIGLRAAGSHGMTCPCPVCDAQTKALMAEIVKDDTDDSCPSSGSACTCNFLSFYPGMEGHLDYCALRQGSLTHERFRMLCDEDAARRAASSSGLADRFSLRLTREQLRYVRDWATWNADECITATGTLVYRPIADEARRVLSLSAEPFSEAAHKIDDTERARLFILTLGNTIKQQQVIDLMTEVRRETGVDDPILKLAALLREAGLVPYLHGPCCATWHGGSCDMGCGP